MKQLFFKTNTSILVAVKGENAVAEFLSEDYYSSAQVKFYLQYLLKYIAIHVIYF